MSDNKGVRLAKAALEINIGIETIVEHLKKRGFEVENRPNTKLTDEMYSILLKDFRAEKNLRERADQINLRPTKDKKDEEHEVATIKTSPVIVKETIPVKETTPIFKEITPIFKETILKPIIDTPQPDLKPSQDTPQHIPANDKQQQQAETDSNTTDDKKTSQEYTTPPAPQKETPITITQPEQEPVLQIPPDKDNAPNDNKPQTEQTNKENTKPESEITRLGNLKVVDKIDLDKLKQEEKDKLEAARKEREKKRKKEREKAKKERERQERLSNNTPANTHVTPPAPSDKNEKRIDIRTPQVINKDQSAGTIDPEKEVSKIEARKLDGLTVLGKIELPTQGTEKDGKKRTEKRKRIVKDKKVALEDSAKTVSVDGKSGRGDNRNDRNRNNNNNRTDQNNRDKDRKPNTQGSSGGSGGGRNQNNNNNNNNNNRNASGGNNNNNNNNNRNTGKDQPRRRNNDRNDNKQQQPATGQPTLVTEKQIQEQMRATMARMAGTTKGKNDRSKNRKLKREQHAERRAEDIEDGKTLQVTEFISVSELAKLMDVSATEVITTCFNLGMMVTINYRLDAELIEVVANEFGFDIEFVSATEQDEANAEIPDAPEDLLPRPPIVTIMGHVDHGKTSLLDYIRNANVVAGEVGGITQHIGAYSVELADGREITFLDTPGHEAFTAMRARGAKVTDIAVIVIAADDGIMERTKEAISHAQAANVPIVFAINKIDKPGANPERIKEQLAQMNLLVEDWGGEYQSQEISAKKGINVDLLLEKILLQAEILELKANPNKRGIGTIIEASLDKGKGYVSTVLVQSGTMRVGDPILAGQYYGKVKAMFNERGTKIKAAGPSQSVMVLGLNGAPQAGDKMRIAESEQDARNIALKREQLLREQQQRTKKHITLEEIGRRLALGNFKELNLIIKGDVDGSVEALTDSLLKLSRDEVQVRIIHRSVGAITESDVLLASASDAIIIGFQVRPSPQARRQAEQEDIDIRLYSIIYDAIEEVKSAMEGLLEPTIEEKFACNIEVRDVFKITKVGTVAGCYVQEGKVFRDTKVRLVRDGVVIYTGSIDSLKRFKDDVKEVASGYECGISLRNFSDIKEGDYIEGYEEIEIKRKLT